MIKFKLSLPHPKSSPSIPTPSHCTPKTKPESFNLPCKDVTLWLLLIQKSSINISHWALDICYELLNLSHQKPSCIGILKSQLLLLHIMEYPLQHLKCSLSNFFTSPEKSYKIFQHINKLIIIIYVSQHAVFSV